MLTLTGLEGAADLAATDADAAAEPLAAPANPSSLLEAVLEAHWKAGVAGWLALDGAEYYDLESGSPPLPRLLASVLTATGLKARLPLNATPAARLG